MSINNTSIIQAFTLFNEKAQKLQRLSFIQSMVQSDVGVSYSLQLRDDGNYDQYAERRGPDEEAIDAFVLTFRFFIQDNEKSSLRNMAECYEKALVSSKLKDTFAEVRNELNLYLDQPSFINFNYNGENFTRRKIMEIFIYGGMAHANSAKKQLYDEWMSIPLARTLLENEFVSILTDVLNAIIYIRNVNEQAIAELRVMLTDEAAP